MRLTSTQLFGLTSTNAELMGKPHINAHYEREDVNSHKLDENAHCAICGRKAIEVHHVVPKGRARGFTVNTPLGRFVTMTPLFAVCRYCHEKFHSHAYSVEWIWSDEQYQEEWWSGHTLAHICRAHNPFLWQEGYYLFRDKEEKVERVLQHGRF